MIITVCCANTKVQPWLEGLRAALPDASVSEWTPGAALADYAVVWAPPQQFIDEQHQLSTQPHVVTAASPARTGGAQTNPGTLTIRVKKSDATALANGSITPDEFRKRVTTLVY